MRRARWIYCCFFIVAAATTVHGKTFFVEPGQSIQDAIDEAATRPGPDMIKIAAGDYEEDLEIDDPDKLTLAGSGESVLVAADSSKNVIKIDGGDVTISNLAVTGGKDGIKAEEMTSLTLRDLVVTANADEGLQAEDVSRVKIANCTFSQNGGDGVGLEKVDTAELTHITVLENDDGVDIEKSGNIHVTHLTACGNADEGFEVDDTDSVVIVGGTVSDNDDDGLDLDDTQSIRIVSVISTGNAGNGLQIEAEEDYDTDSVEVVQSTFSDNDEDGIKIVEEDAVVNQVRLSNITAQNNVESGLDIDVSGSVKVTNVTSTNNGQPDILP